METNFTPAQVVLAVLISGAATLWMVGEVPKREASAELTTCQQQVSTLTNNIAALVYGAPKHPTTTGE